MNPDPLRALDRIDPPDQWDDIARRATDDDVRLDLDETGTGPGRRRAAALVAMAAAVALVAGIAVAGARDTGDEGVVATDPPATTAPTAACPFTLDPAADVGTLEPGPPPIPGAVGRADGLPPTLGTVGHTEVDGRAVVVSVGEAGRAPLEGSLFHAGLEDGSTRVWFHRGAELDGAPAGCAGAHVGVDISALTDVIDGLRLVPGEPGEDPAAVAAAAADGELAPIDAAIARVVDAIRVEAPAGDTPPMVVGDCPFTLAGEGIPAPVAHEIPRQEGELPELVRTTAQVTLDGHLVTVALGGLPQIDAPMFGPAGTLEVATGIADPATGTVRVSGIEALPTEPPCQDLQVWVDAPSDDVDAATEVIERVLAAVVPAEPLDEADRAIRAEARDRLAARQAEAERCDADPSCVPMTWEGPTADGGTYRIEVDQDVIRGFVDGVQVNTDGEVPVWEDIAGETVMGAVGFEVSARPAGTAQDVIFVGARPPGAAETFVSDPAGDEIAVDTLTISPDGRFYAVHGLELPVNVPGTPWPVHHRDASGALIVQPAGG